MQWLFKEIDHKPNEICKRFFWGNFTKTVRKCQCSYITPKSKGGGKNDKEAYYRFLHLKEKISFALL